MNTSFNFELSQRPNRKGKYPVYLRITQNRKSKRIKTSIELNKASDWNKKSHEVRKSEPNAKVWNDVLSKELEKANSSYRKLRDEGKATLENIISDIRGTNDTDSFITFAENYIERTLQSGELNTAKKYRTFLNKLKFFINGRNPKDIIKYRGKKLTAEIEKMNKELLFTEIDIDFLNRFKAFMQKQPNSRNQNVGLSLNTIDKQFDQFASLFAKGLTEIEGLANKIKDNPFKKLERKTESTQKEKLTIEEIRKINALELEKGSLIWHCRNYFMFSFYCAGIRAGDLIQLRQRDIKNGRVEFRMGKTEKFNSIKLLPPAIEILTEYMDIEKPIANNFVFPLLDNNAPYALAMDGIDKEQLPSELKPKLLQYTNNKNSLINNYLNKIAKMAGIDKNVTMHIARHSFADIARQKDVSVFDICKLLGHSSIKITENYLANFDIEKQDKTLEKVYDIQ